mgnify:CR=1 FL=1
MSKIKKHKVTFLSPELKVEKLDEYSIKLGVNRSQLINKGLDEYIYFLDNQFIQHTRQPVTN